MQPRVTIGLPVYNGENYLGETLDALLAQTYHDFHLVISDNASTDGTEEICRAAAKRDQRVRYLRQDHNLGAAPNYNAVFDQSTSELFMWATHDDLKYPAYVARCVEALDQHPYAVLAYARFEEIDELGRRGAAADPRPELESEDVAVRLERVITRQDPRWPRNNTYPIFGVIRSAAIAAGKPHGGYPGSDRVFLAELALRGPFVEVPDILMGYRFHEQQSMAAATGEGSNRAAWFDTARAGKPGWPNWRRQRELFDAIARAPLSAADRRRCRLVATKVIGRGEWRHMAADLGRGVQKTVSKVASGRP